MNTILNINSKELRLNRFPPSNDKNLQAWDSSDEYVINYLTEQQLMQCKLLIINDTFGALACALSEHELYWQTDSRIAQCAVEQNLADNYLTPSIEYLDSLTAPTVTPDVVLLKLPKSNALLEQQLQQINQVMDANTLVIGFAKAKDVHTSGLKLFEKYIGSTTTSLAKKKSRLIFATPTAQKRQDDTPQLIEWPLENTSYTISNHAGVFANSKLDIGARLMLENLPSDLGEGYAIDLGCGNGVLGLMLANNNPEATIRFTDESFMAIASAKLNCDNAFGNSERFEFDWHDCLSDYDYDQADLIICNPPFHQLKTVTDHIAWQMFNDAYRTLKHGGKLRIVGNRHLGYHIKLQRIFDNCTTIASNSKFVILEATKA
ncbi:MAG: methyltransferase [Psychrobium sp.]